MISNPTPPAPPDAHALPGPDAPSPRPRGRVWRWLRLLAVAEAGGADDGGVSAPTLAHQREIVGKLHRRLQVREAGVDLLAGEAGEVEDHRPPFPSCDVI